VQRLLDPPALPVELGEHAQRVGQHATGGRKARWCGGGDRRSVGAEEVAPRWPTS
jgi:hypothetical protein